MLKASIVTWKFKKGNWSTLGVIILLQLTHVRLTLARMVVPVIFREVVVTDAFVVRDIVGIFVKSLKVRDVPNGCDFIENVRVVYARHASVKQYELLDTEYGVFRFSGSSIHSSELW